MNELKRIYSKRVCLLFILLAALNFVLFMFSCDENRDITLSGGGLDEYISSYGGFIDNIIGQSGTLSLLNIYDEGFGAKNIAKTAEDYSRLSGTVLISGDNRGAVVFSNYHLTDIFLAAFMIIISAKLLDERRNGLVGLVRSTRGGRVRLYLSRTAALIFSAVLGAVCLYGGNIAGVQLAYGEIGISRPIQSIPEFQMCPYRLTVGGYLAASTALKAAACLTAAMAFFLLASLFGTAGAYLFGGAAAAAELLCYLLIPPVSAVNHLKFINLTALIRADDFFKLYCNLNIFGKPISFLAAAVSALPVVFTVCFAAGIFVHGRLYVSREHFAERLLLRLREKLERRAVCRTLFGWEGYKLAVRQYAGLIIIAVFAAALSQAAKYSYFYYTDPYAVEWYAKYEGEITEGKLSDMEADKDKLEHSIELFQGQMDKMLAEGINDFRAFDDLRKLLEKTQDKYNALLPILEDAQSGLEYTVRTGRSIRLIKPYSYDMLLNRDLKTVRRGSIFILIGIIAAVSGVYSFDRQNHMEQLLRSAYRGRRAVNVCKLAWVCVICSAAALSVHLIQLNIISSDMGLNDLDAPIQSLAFLRGFEPYITIKQYLFLLFAARMAAACAAGLVCAGISRLSKDTSVSLGISAFAAALLSLAPTLIGGADAMGIISLLGGEPLM